MTREHCKAWMLPLGEGRHAAIGEHEMVHIIPEWVRLQSIPFCPVYCHKVFTWQGQLIPVFDLHAWLHKQDSMVADITRDAMPIICIVAYENENREVIFGGMLLSALPFRTDVSDDLFCDFPDDSGLWNTIAVSCFSGPVAGPAPVLDLPRLFSSLP